MSVHVEQSRSDRQSAFNHRKSQSERVKESRQTVFFFYFFLHFTSLYFTSPDRRCLLVLLQPEEPGVYDCQTLLLLHSLPFPARHSCSISVAGKPNCSSPCLLVCVSARACVRVRVRLRVRVRVRVLSQQMGIMEPAKGVGSPKPQLWL